VPRGSGLRSQLNRALRQLIDDGFVARTYARWMLDASECAGGKMAAAAAVRASGSGSFRRRMTSTAVADVSRVIIIIIILFAQ